MPTVDTLVAQHLLKTVTAIRLMGADCIISGMRPQIAQTIVHLGVDLRGRDDQGEAGRRAGAGAEAQRPDGHPGQDGVAGAMERIPILRMGEFLLVTIQVDMHDQLALTLQDDLTTAMQRIGAKGVLIDISSLEMVDSFIGRMIANISADGAHPRCADGGGRHAAGGRDHARRARPEPARRGDGARRRARHAAAAPASRNPERRLSTSKNDVLPLRTEHDIVLARQHVRRLTQELGFALVDQTKMVTAASELARNAVIYGLAA